MKNHSPMLYLAIREVGVIQVIQTHFTDLAEIMNYETFLFTPPLLFVYLIKKIIVAG